MSNVAPFYKVEDDGENTKYYLKGATGQDTEITADQYAALEQYGESNTDPVSGDLSEASIAKLHAEQDPASPLFAGSQPVNAGVSGTAAENPQPASAYYEPTGDKVDPIADTAQEPQGTTTISTEEATKPYEAPEPEVEPTPAVETPVETEPETQPDPAQASSEPVESVIPTEEDASITGA